MKVLKKFYFYWDCLRDLKSLSSIFSEEKVITDLINLNIWYSTFNLELRIYLSKFIFVFLKFLNFIKWLSMKKITKYLRKVFKKYESDIKKSSSCFRSLRCRNCHIDHVGHAGRRSAGGRRNPLQNRWKCHDQGCSKYTLPRHINFQYRKESLGLSKLLSCTFLLASQSKIIKLQYY